MNFLSHAIPHMDRPLVAVCTGVPDWLSVIDRKIRIRPRMAAAHLDSGDPAVAAVAAGVMQHIDDDRWFHGTESFVQTNLRLAVQLRDLLPGDAGFRPMFLGHVLIEVLLDAMWIDQDPSLAERYYAAVKQTNASEIQRAINIISGKPSTAIEATVVRYHETAFLYDYGDDNRLHHRMNQVMHRVGLTPLPQCVQDWYPQAREIVAEQRHRLLSPPAGSKTRFPDMAASSMTTMHVQTHDASTDGTT